MNLINGLLHQIADASITPSQKAILRCRTARQLEQLGDHEGARQALGPLWQRIGEPPLLDGLDAPSKAEVLLRAGALTGWIGSARQIEGAQEIAKDLISDSIRMFESLHLRNKVAEAHADLAVCYWREGAFDEARVILKQSMNDFDEDNTEQRAVALLRLALVERASKRPNDALRIYTDALQLFQGLSNHFIRAQYHSGFGNVLAQLGAAESREDYTDTALIQYSAASFHVDQAGNTRLQACLENNIACLSCVIQKYKEAHDHLDRAQALFTRLKDAVHLAQVDETRARVMLAEGRIVEAEKTVRAAVRTLEQGDEQSLLAEALTTHGVALARLQHPDQSKAALQRALEVAERAGDLESAGNAALILLEELDTHLSNDELKSYVERARELLANSQDLSTLKRLAKCAVGVLANVHASARFPGAVNWKNFSLKASLLDYEAHFIKLALDDANGVVTHAARLLGFNHHQSLLTLLNGRHEILRQRAVPIVPRRRSIIRKERNGSRKGKRKGKDKLSILYIDADVTTGQLMQDSFSQAGCDLEICIDWAAAIEKLSGGADYGLVLLALETPGFDKSHILELAQQRNIPLIVMSESGDQDIVENGFAIAQLRKPLDAGSAAKTVEQVLQSIKA